MVLVCDSYVLAPSDKSESMLLVLEATLSVTRLHLSSSLSMASACSLPGLSLVGTLFHVQLD